MPDPSQIHGRAIPAPELPDGTVTVRVVRESIGNNIAGQEVRVTDSGATRKGTTDELGRAEFRDLVRGSQARAEATVDGEMLESQPFPVPAKGGLRVILVAGMARAAERRKQEQAEAAAAPAVKGAVVIGGESRIVMEFRDDELWVFYVLEVINSARTKVDTGGPLIIDLPRRATSVRVLEGSSPTAQVNDTRITVVGPFASGATPVQVGFLLPHSSTELVFEQTFPAAVQRVQMGVQKVGTLSIASKQFATVSDVKTEGGTLFALGTGPTLAAGNPLTVTLSNLPVRPQTARNVGLALALGIVAFGAWLAATSRTTGSDVRAALVRRRDELLAEVARLEAKRRAGDIGLERYAARRQRAMTELEQIYGELDEAGSGPQGGGEGIAA